MSAGANRGRTRDTRDQDQAQFLTTHSPASTSRSSSSAASSRRASIHSNATSIFNDPGFALQGNLPQQHPAMPARLPSQPSAVQIYDALEKEQEAIVNRLQRELSLLREEQQQAQTQQQQAVQVASPRVKNGHSRTDSSSSSRSRNASSRSVLTSVGASAVSDSEESVAPPTPSSGYPASFTPQVQRSSSTRRNSRPSFGSTSGMSSAEDLYISSLRKENDSLKKRISELMKTLGEKDADIATLQSTLEHLVLDRSNDTPT
ncbi:uncharacterized protein V1518DRAFT_218366 [Limtongia smithiae]|uniref:uncharacterized protein n=1 Tax=Limtongia smithiae TaxID=1125753 RepID=UPI0034CE295B